MKLSSIGCTVHLNGIGVGSEIPSDGDRYLGHDDGFVIGNGNGNDGSAEKKITEGRGNATS